MNEAQISPVCNSQRTEAYLSNDLNSADEANFLGHLNECRHCREELEELAAKPDD